jgi:dynein heavy chain
MPTIDSFRAEMILSYILKQQKASPQPLISCSFVVLVGGSGTAKTSSVLMYANKFNKENMLFKRINFSSATLPSHF